MAFLYSRGECSVVAPNDRRAAGERFAIAHLPAALGAGRGRFERSNPLLNWSICAAVDALATVAAATSISPFTTPKTWGEDHPVTSALLIGHT